MRCSFRVYRSDRFSQHLLSAVTPLLAMIAMGLVILSSLLSTSAHAEVMTIDTAINKAGMQRMLTQRITKSYLLIGQDVAADKAQKQLDSSLALFEEHLGELEEFSPAPAVTDSLQSIRREWNKFRQLAIGGPEHSQALSLITGGSRLLELCEKNVQLLEAHSSKGKGELINISGRQRMLSQRIGMLYVAKSWKITDEALDKAFQQALSEFDHALQRLSTSPFNTSEISQALKEVTAQWEFSRSGFDLGQSGHYVPFVIQVTTESMLKKMDKITDLYVSLEAS